MHTATSGEVSVAEGLHGDFRSALASSKGTRKRQVSLIEGESWRAAQADSRCLADWFDARRNLLVEGLRLPREPGARIAIGASLVLEVTCECDPCERMDALHQGLRAALTSDWRGGVLARVITDGHIAVDDTIRIL
jgi:MOSC domain-containing protein YiiM